MSQATQDPDPTFEEKGVGDRKILVMHPGPETMKIAGHLARQDESDDPDHTRARTDGPSKPSDEDDSSSGSAAEERPSSITTGQAFQREITFADEIRPTRARDAESESMPAARAADRHIAFLERQRNPQDDSVLYIPGPRDWDRGDVPQLLDGSDSVESPRTGMNPLRGRFRDRPFSRARSMEPPANQGVGRKDSVDESSTPNTVKKAHSWRTSFGRKDTDETARTSEKSNMWRAPSQLRRFATFASGRDDVDLMPYLSYQPTVGRNSAFVNLTEDQRDELGGIEYRTLKTLVIVLCCRFF